MIGALAIKNRRKKLNRNESTTSQVTHANVFTQKCNILFVAAGVFIIVGLIVLIPVCFGDTNFLIYSGSSFALGIIIFVIACLFNTSDGKELEECDVVRSNVQLPNNNDSSRRNSSLKRYTRSNGLDIESAFTAEVDLKTELTTTIETESIATSPNHHHQQQQLPPSTLPLETTTANVNDNL